MEEIYKQIKDYPLYEISNYGNCRNIKTNRILKPSRNSTGYNIINLRNNKTVYNTTINKLVRENFKDIPIKYTDKFLKPINIHHNENYTVEI